MRYKEIITMDDGTEYEAIFKEYHNFRYVEKLKKIHSGEVEE